LPTLCFPFRLTGCVLFLIRRNFSDRGLL